MGGPMGDAPCGEGAPKPASIAIVPPSGFTPWPPGMPFMPASAAAPPNAGPPAAPGGGGAGSGPAPGPMPAGGTPTTVPARPGFTGGGAPGGGGGAPGGPMPGGIIGCWLMSMVPLNFGAAAPFRLNPHLTHVDAVSAFCVPQLGQNTHHLRWLHARRAECAASVLPWRRRPQVKGGHFFRVPSERSITRASPSA